MTQQSRASLAEWIVRRPFAHRGLHDGNHAVWENTLSSFDAAIERQFAIECDVTFTADGIPVVFHDHDIKRLTGHEGVVNEMTADTLTALKVGETHDHVPTLARVLDHVSGRVPLLIELKGTEGKDDGFVASVGALLKNYAGPAAIMSFDHWLIRRFRVDAPGVAAGLTAIGNKEEDLEKHFSMLSHDIDFTSFYVDQIKNGFTAFMKHTLNRPVLTWTVRTPHQVQATARYADQMTFEGFDPDAS